VTTPADSDRVLLALRFGWALAEVRGRLRNPHWDQSPSRPALPLSDERSWPEQTIETEKIANALADKLGLDVRHNDDGAKPSFQLIEFSEALRESAGSEREKAKWDEFSLFLWGWDARNQDTLAAESFAIASAYQLGRGLAETFWAIDPDVHDPKNPASVLHLLGPGREQIFSQLLPRLSAYFAPSTTAAVQTSFGAWAKVAEDGLFEGRSGLVLDALHKQLKVWHDLLLVGQDPDALVSSKDVLEPARRIGPVLRAFLPEVSLGLASLTAAIGAAVLFALGTENHWIAAVLSVISFFGVTSAGALAKVKDEAHSLFTQLRQAMNTDLAKEAVTLPPAHAYLDPKRGLFQQGPRERALAELSPSTTQAPG